MGEEEIAAALEVLRARSLFRFYGPDVQRYSERLENAYAERLGRKYALAVNSGTAALSTAMGALGLGPGDEVLVPGYLWVSCVAAVVRAGAIPRLVDIDDTFCIDPADLVRKIGPHSRAVLMVHMSGAPGAVDEVAKICAERGLSLIEDCAQANGASYRGRPVGAFGDAAIFSFQQNKNITAGEGGLFVCDDDRLFQRAVACHDLGYPRNLSGRIDPSDPELQLWGQGSRCPELTAAVVYAQLGKIEQIVATLRRNKYALRERLPAITGFKLRRVLDPAGDSGPFEIVSWPSREMCLRIVEATNRMGIRSGPSGLNNVPMTQWGLHIYYNNASLVGKRSLNAAGRPWTDPLNAFAAEYSYAKGTLPVLDDLVDRSSILCIPPGLTEQHIEHIGSAFAEASLLRGSR